jgi:hypothetical protein
VTRQCLQRTVSHRSRPEPARSPVRRSAQPERASAKRRQELRESPKAPVPAVQQTALEVEVGVEVEVARQPEAPAERVAERVEAVARQLSAPAWVAPEVELVQQVAAARAAQRAEPHPRDAPRVRREGIRSHPRPRGIASTRARSRTPRRLRVPRLLQVPRLRSLRAWRRRRPCRPLRRGWRSAPPLPAKELPSRPCRSRPRRGARRGQPCRRPPSTTW